MRETVAALSLFFCLAGLAFPQIDEPYIENEPVKATETASPGLKVSSGLSYSFLRVSKSSAIPMIESEVPFLNGAVHQVISGCIGMELEMGRLVINSGLGGQVSLDNMASSVTKWENIHRSASASLEGASARLKAGDIENPFMNLSFGYFGYGYTRVKNFGGYLYTSGLHPMYLTSAGGGASLLGVMLQANAPSKLRHDLVVNLETDWAPYMDISAGYVGTLNFDDKAEIGAGIKLHRMIPAGSEDTDARLVRTEIVTKEKTVYDTVEYEDENGDMVTEIDTSIAKETVDMPYSGIKLMLRGYFDPLKTFDVPTGNFWGENDLRVYGEVGINGINDYPLDVRTGLGYDNILDRIPVMGGVNMPTHPLIGNLAVPLALSMFLIAVEPDSIYFDEFFDTYEDVEKKYPDFSDSMVVDEYNYYKLHISEETDENGIISYDTVKDASGNLQWFPETDYRAVITNKRGFFRKDKLARPFICVAGSIISGVGTFLLEKLVGEKLRLDEITLEVEYSRSPYKNNPDVGESGMPEPVSIIDQTYVPPIPPEDPELKSLIKSSQRRDSKEWHKDDFRWALMFQKSFAGRFNINGKVASDHFRQRDAWGFYSNIERMFAYYEWYWTLGFGVNF